MIVNVRATYRNGALMPEVPLDLEDEEEVILTVEKSTPLRNRFMGDRQQTTPEERLKKMEEVRKRFSELLKDAKDGPSAVEIGDWLYDENGLPK